MAIIQSREVARADMNDEFGVTVWQEAQETAYTTTEARALAAEIMHAADEADRIHLDDVHESTLDPLTSPTGEQVL